MYWVTNPPFRTLFFTLSTFEVNHPGCYRLFIRL